MRSQGGERVSGSASVSDSLHVEPIKLRQDHACAALGRCTCRVRQVHKPRKAGLQGHAPRGCKSPSTSAIES